MKKQGIPTKRIEQKMGCRNRNVWRDCSSLAGIPKASAPDESWGSGGQTPPRLRGREVSQGWLAQYMGLRNYSFIYGYRLRCIHPNSVGQSVYSLFLNVLSNEVWWGIAAQSLQAFKQSPLRVMLLCFIITSVLCFYCF